MSQWKQKMVPITMAAMLLAPTTSIYGETLSVDEQIQKTLIHQNKEQIGTKGFHKNNLKLVEKYAPEKLSQWKAITEEREKLIKELKGLKGQGIKNKERKNDCKKDLKEKKYFRSEEIKQKRTEMKQLYQKLDKAVEAQDGKTIQSVLDQIYGKEKEKNEFLKKRIQELKEKNK